MKRVYLDYASTTPLDPRVKESMEPFWSDIFANAGSRHQSGFSARGAVDDSRNKIAGLLQVRPEEIIFTSGGTESNNLAIIGLLNYLEERKNLSDAHVVVSTIEHPSVLEIIERYKSKGLKVDLLNVGSDGLVNIAHLKEVVKENTVLVSVMYVNSEIGTIQPLREISNIIKKKNPNIFLHTDASQAPLYLKINPESLGVDMMSLDAQKIYGPKGVGILYKKNSIKISPVFWGGSQEGGLRPGTENTPLIVGMAKALTLALEGREENSKRVLELRDYFIDKLLVFGRAISLNGSRGNRIANNINITVLGENSEMLFIKLDKKGISCATKSACLNDKSEGSYVLEALGHKQKDGLRFSLGLETTKEEIDFTLNIIKEILTI